MGMFLDDTAMLVIVAPLYVPLVIALGFDPIWYGVLYTITCQIAYITPPFGYNLFLMRAMAPPEITLPDIYRSIVPFVLIMLVALAIITAFPQIALWLPQNFNLAIRTNREKNHDQPTQFPEAGRPRRRRGGRRLDAGRALRQGAGADQVALQTYAGAPLGAFVIKPAIDAFNKAANGEMEIELYFSDQLVPQGELFRAVQQGTLDAVQSDDDSMGSPADVAQSSAPTSPSPPATRSTCRRCSPTTA